MNDLRLVRVEVVQTERVGTAEDAFQSEIGYVHRTLRRLGASPSELHDLAHDMFLALRRAWPKYDQSRPLRPYLLGFAFRIAATHRRKRQREAAVEVPDISDYAPRPDDALASKQARWLVFEALKAIPLPRRAVLIMHELDGMAIADIAGELGIPRFTAYSRMRKARREMHAALREILGADERP
jgi:RNA polymerase sigma-70 factor (ECF subfamily)